MNWSDNPFIDALDAISFTNNFTTATAFTANFTGSAITNPIVISEINYNPDASFNGGDWIELHNSADVAVNVSSYQLKEKYFYSDFTIPENSVIPANGYLVLAEDKNMFNQKYPAITNVVGDFHFSLKNDSDLIVLTDMIGNTIIQLNYADNRPWPFTADGYGRTMELVGALLNPALPGL
ncbi:MAG: lamin tail domain-containing protein [Bacteroidetes bacterium]|nr:lamin tail domain-containing protein [Bacteroidota bacterium]